MSNSNNIPITWNNEQDNNLLGSLFPGGANNFSQTNVAIGNTSSKSYDEITYENNYGTKNKCSDYSNNFYTGAINIKELISDLRNNKNSDKMFFYYEKYTNNLPKKVVVYPTQNMDVQFDTIPVEIPFTYKNNLSQTEVKTNLKVSLNFRACQVNINKPGFVFFISSKEKKISFQIKFIYSDAVNKKVYNQDTAIKNDYSIDDKYEGIIIKTEKADDLIAVCREIGNEEFAKISIEDLFIRRLKVENSAEELRFLYENLPDFVLNKLFALIGEKMLLQHLMILTEYDDTGLFSGFKDGSSALINILKAFNDSDTLYNLFKNDQVLVKRIYGNLDGTSEYENQTKSNKIIFSSLLYGLCVKNGFNGLERKDKTFYYGNEYKFDANVSAVRNDEKNDEFFIQQLRVIPLFGADILYPLTENIEEDKGSMYHPLEIVQFIDMDSKDKQPLPMPAIFVKALSDEVELQEIETSIRIGFDLLGVVLGVIVTSTTGNPTLFALALADIGLATTDGAIQSFKKEILELEGGEEFIATWEKIYLVGGAITAGPVVISSFLKLGTSILRLAEIAKNFNALKFTQTCMMKVILEIEIANFTKNTVKEIIFGEEALKATGTSFNMAGVTRLQKEGVLFIKAINSDGKAGNIAVIYKGEAIASGTAKEVRESLKDLWASRGVLLSNQLNEIFEVTNFISKLSSKLKTEVNEAFFWSGHTDRIGGEEIALSIATSKKGITLEGLIKRNNIDFPIWNSFDKKVKFMWELASKKFGEQVSGEIRAVIGERLRKNNIWENFELPALKNNPRVTKITIIDPKTKIEKVIYKNAIK